MIDIEASNHGSIMLIHAKTQRGSEWLREHIDPKAMRYAGAVVVEPRFIADIIEGALTDGLNVGGARL